jgi:hypothetical protein
MSVIFAAPIPGQSLTSEPKARPFERPPEIVDPIDALDMHIENITRVEALEDAFHFLEMGLTLTALVEGVLRSAVMEGLHSIDVSLMIAPVLHEYIKGLALEADVKFEEGFKDEEDDKVLGYSRDRQKALQMLEELREKTEEPALEMPKENITEQEPEEAMQEPMPEAPQGLMARR